MKNKYIKTFSIIILFIFFLVIGVTYSYFTATSSGGESTSTISVGGGTLAITVSGGNNINISNVLPSNDTIVTKTFTINGTNTTDLAMPYTINLIIESNTFSNGSITYTLNSTNTNNNGVTVSSIDTQKGINTGSSVITLGRGTFSYGINKIHTYVLKMYFPMTDDNQNSEQGKSIEGHIEILGNQANEKIYFNSYLITLAGNSSSTGFYEENGYRYEGLNPNNYINFNDEVWRIIGVFDETSHGINGQNLVKIIKVDSINNYQWNDSNNNWSNSSLKTTLNNYYSSLSQEIINMIENVTWKLGGWTTVSANSNNFYSYERGTTIFSGNDLESNGYIGLMYPSDYGYAVLETNCARSTTLYAYNAAGCYNQNWLYGGEDEWTITAYSSVNNSVFYINLNGSLNGEVVTNSFNVRPVIYLKNGVLISDGNGSESNPYQIYID